LISLEADNFYLLFDVLFVSLLELFKYELLFFWFLSSLNFCLSLLLSGCEVLHWSLFMSSDSEYFFLSDNLGILVLLSLINLLSAFFLSECIISYSTIAPFYSSFSDVYYSSVLTPFFTLSKSNFKSNLLLLLDLRRFGVELELLGIWLKLDSWEYFEFEFAVNRESFLFENCSLSAILFILGLR